MVRHVEKHGCNPRHTQAAKGFGKTWYRSKTKMVRGHLPTSGHCEICRKPHSVNSHRMHKTRENPNPFDTTHQTPRPCRTPRKTKKRK